MKYVLLVYLDERWQESLSISDRDAFEDACRASDQALRNSQHLIAGAGVVASDCS